MTEHCICCGAEIPEGRQVCPICAYKIQYQPKTGITDEEAIQQCRGFLSVVMEHAAQHGGLWAWMHEKDPRLYRTLQGLHHMRNSVPTTLTLVKALDAAGYKLVIVPKEDKV